MRVKRLEIQGFKSFKDKTVVHFDHGITGIVGPNGCGKSNIVDAFFWVMGEQSYKHMRGSGSDDLIFNGSSKYNPLGMAEATLVMEIDTPVDTEHAPAGASVEPIHKPKEISVTRRLYRGGEGEYFVNGVSARLKDIQELFMDTGVGAKGYSVIEQGQIGKIVNSKPEERRLLIEEAAGIAKYKARKKESLRKMEAAQTNLARLTDIIQEIERSLGSLERQAQKAQQAKRIKGELLEKEMTWGRRKMRVLTQKLETLRTQKEALETELISLRAELSTIETSVEAERITHLTDTKTAEALQARIQQVSDDLTHEKSALDLSRRRQSDLNAQLDALTSEKSELETSIAEEQLRLDEQEAEASGANGVFDETSRQAQTMNDEVRNLRQQADTARRQHENYKRELMQGISHASGLTSRAASLLSRIESAEAQLARLAEQITEQNERLSSIQEESEKSQLAASETESRRDELKSELDLFVQQVRAQDQGIRELERNRDQANRAYTQVRSKLESLEELAAAHEGLGDASKTALDWARDNGKSLRPLADLLEVEAGYETALEGWLESRLENLISTDPAVAVEAIARVRDEEQGRIAVQIGNSDDASAARGDAASVRAALEQAGFELAGELSQFVKAQGDSVRGFADRSISGVFVVSSMEPMAAFLSAQGLARLQGWGVVSRDGGALDPNGTLRGGSQKTDGAASLMRRKNAIAELQAQVNAAKETLDNSENSLADARAALENARNRQHELQQEVQQLEIQAAAQQRDVHQASRALREAEQQLTNINRDRERAEHDATAAREERAQIEENLQEFVSSRSDLEAKIAEGEAVLSAQDEAVRAREAELQSIKIREAELRERANSLKREMESSRSLIADRQRRMAEINRTLDRASGEREQFSGGEAEMQLKIEELITVLSAAREEYATIKDRIEKSSSVINGGIERVKVLHKSGDRKTSEANHLAIEIEKINSDVQHLTQNLEEKYGVGCLNSDAFAPVMVPEQEEMAAPVVTAEMTAEEEQILSEEVERLRERLRRLGEVNPNAIEEYEELKKRYDFLMTEKSDLERSIENLQEAIEHINKTSVERFKRAFEAIADRFERLFPIIFGGGQAKLSLVYPEGVSPATGDILEAGVDILAQPPGKKVVNIGLLSGGEKALTAVSLIFAIFMVKPSPFCVLDEVDAPLDDANIGKFNALLREMSAKSQFIVITHNKKTMELNDTLYGVTMEEPGVSKMVSIEMH